MIHILKKRKFKLRDIKKKLVQDYAKGDRCTNPISDQSK